MTAGAKIFSKWAVVMPNTYGFESKYKVLYCKISSVVNYSKIK
jgi:hypothetical protein